MTRASTTPSSASMTPSLSLTLAPAEHGDERPLGVLAQAEQHLDLLGQQAPGGRRQRAAAGRRSRRGRGGRRRRRRRRRRRCPRPAGPRRPGRCPPHPGRSAGSRAARRRAPARPAGPRPAPSSSCGSGLPFGRPRWLAHTTVAPRSCSHVIVGSAARMRKSSVIRPSGVVLERHVEVGADEHPLAVDRRQVLEQRQAVHPSSLAARRTRSGRPGGSSSPTRCRTSRAP